MFQKSKQSNNNGVSPNVGIILMVAITVSIAAVLAVVVTDVGQNVDLNAQAGMTIEETPNQEIKIQLDDIQEADHIFVKASQDNPSEGDTPDYSGGILPEIISGPVPEIPPCGVSETNPDEETSCPRPVARDLAGAQLSPKGYSDNPIKNTNKQQINGPPPSAKPYSGGPDDPQQWLLAKVQGEDKRIGGVGTTVTADISDSTDGTLTIIGVVDGKEVILREYDYTGGA